MAKLTTPKKKVSIKKKIPLKKKAKSIVVKKKSIVTPNGRKGGRITKKRKEELIEDGQNLLADGTFSQYSEIALAERWKLSRGGARSIIKILLVESKENLLLRKAKYAGLYDRLERNMTNILDASERIRKCQSSACRSALGYSWEGEASECPKCGIPTKKDIGTQIAMSERIPDLLDRTTGFMERFGMKEVIANKVQLDANITQKQLIINYEVKGHDQVKQ